MRRWLGSGELGTMRTAAARAHSETSWNRRRQRIDDVARLEEDLWQSRDWRRRCGVDGVNWWQCRCGQRRRRKAGSSFAVMAEMMPCGLGTLAGLHGSRGLEESSDGGGGVVAEMVQRRRSSRLSGGADGEHGLGSCWVSIHGC
ncbi:hypothetical protein M0R45_008968 [Rubus argutus]|uniref:Uncharacterized protein n=1 Tax=Rubus argutus TaxID=59490 RepID=A0AAW1Y2P8_RUBAR